jgi:DNA-binding transcriptional MerR regulator
MRYPIQVVARMTGLTPATLRAWESRYQAISPERQANGRRVYTEESVRRLKLLAALVDNGYRISDLVGLDEGELDTLHRELEPSQHSPAGGSVQFLLDQAVASVVAVDAPRLTRLLQDAVAHIGQLELADRVVFPLLSRVEALVESKKALPVHLSMLTSTLTAFLYSQLRSLSEHSDRRRIAVAVPRGQAGSVGAIASTIHVVTAGWYPVMLGSDIAASELSEALRTADCDALLLSIVTDTEDPQLQAEMEKLAGSVGAEIPIFFGGKLPSALVRSLENLGLRYLHSMENLRDSLLSAA